MDCYFLDIFPVSYHLVWEEYFFSCHFRFCWYLCSSILRNNFPSKNYYAKFAKFKENSPLIKSYRTKYTYPWTFVVTKQSPYLPKCSVVMAVVKPCQYLFNHLLSNQKYFNLGWIAIWSHTKIFSTYVHFFLVLCTT